MDSQARAGAALTRRHFLLGAAAIGVLAGCGSAQAATATTAQGTPTVLSAMTRAGAPPPSSGVAAGTPTMTSLRPTPAGASAADGVSTAGPAGSSAGAAGSSAGQFEVTHTDEQWRMRLTADQYDVLRDAGTEAPFTSPLLDEHRAGTFTCAGCALDLFSSTTKFDSGTGWPSFWQALDNSVLTSADESLGMDRTEVKCRRCGSHIGHVFDDGPAPTGLRYCMNGVALEFRAA